MLIKYVIYVIILYYLYKIFKYLKTLIIDSQNTNNHENTDEAFIVIEGKIFIEFEDKTEEINKGEMIVVPKGVVHRPYAKNEAKIMIIEPTGVVNTGNITDKLTAPTDDWI